MKFSWDYLKLISSVVQMLILPQVKAFDDYAGFFICQ